MQCGSEVFISNPLHREAYSKDVTLPPLEQSRLTRTEDIVASCSLVWWKYVPEPGFTLSAEKFKIDDPYASVEPTTTNIYVGSEHFRENMSASTSAASEPWVFHPNRQRGPRDRLCVMPDL